MRKLIALLLLAFALGAHATQGKRTEDGQSGPIKSTGDALHVYGTNDPSATRNPDFGAQETSNAGTTTYYSTNGDKQVRTGVGAVKRVLAASGTSVTVSFWDDADGTCSSGQVSGTIPLTSGVPIELGFEFGTGICMTIGGTSPTVTVVTLP